MKTTTTLLLTGSLFVALAGLTPAQAAVDEAAAMALAKANDCTTEESGWLDSVALIQDRLPGLILIISGPGRFFQALRRLKRLA